MEIKGLQDYEYTPEWNGNREDPAPVKIKMQPLSSMQRERSMEIETAVAGTATMRPNLSEICRYGIKEISGLKVDGVEIKNVVALLNSRGLGLDNLVRECGIEIFVANQRPDLKNS